MYISLDLSRSQSDRDVESGEREKTVTDPRKQRRIEFEKREGCSQLQAHSARSIGTTKSWLYPPRLHSVCESRRCGRGG
jgi:hypothetical protein